MKLAAISKEMGLNMEEKMELNALLKELGVQSLVIDTSIDGVPFVGRQMVVAPDKICQHIELKSKTLAGFIANATAFRNAILGLTPSYSGLTDAIQEGLKEIRLQHQVEDEDINSGLRLIDALSCGDDVSTGLAEIQHIADDVADAVLDFLQGSK